jgi:hypothetical protein
MAYAWVLAPIEEIDVLFSLKLVAILKTCILFPLHSSSSNRPRLTE